MSRNQNLAKIHIAKKQLGMDDDTYRAVLLRFGKKESAADLSIPEMEKVLEHMKRSGFKVRSKKIDRPQANDDQSKMIRGLWLELGGMEVVRNSSESALGAFVKRMTKVDTLQWLSSRQASQVIEHLKEWRERIVQTRRQQLLKLQDTVIDLEDLSSGVSIADLTLNDFRIDLAGQLREHPGMLDSMPLGSFAITTTAENGEGSIPPGMVFCLRAAGEAGVNVAESGYPLAPHYMVHVGDDGAVLLPFTQAKQILDRLKKLCIGRDMPDATACARFDKATRDGKDMAKAQDLLGKAIASVVGKKEEKAVASLFSPGGTHAQKGEFAGMNDFEVVAWLAVLPERMA